MKDLSSFLGLTNYLREHVRDFASISAPLYALTQTGIEFKWTSEHTLAFESLKRALIGSPVLAYPTSTGEFILDTDASDQAIGAVLSQVQNDVTRVISYGSFCLSPAQRNYCTTRKELLAVVRFTRQYRHYLLGRPFLLRTDHHSLTWLMRFKQIGGQLARWLEELSQYNMIILHRSGRKHANADALSRRPSEDPVCDCYNAGADPSSLPCGGCKYCCRVHEQWEQFETDVDDVVPLAVRALTATAASSPVPSTHWVPGYSSEELSSMQKADVDISPVIDWVTSGQDPSLHTLWLSSPMTKELWLNRDLLQLTDQGVLQYRWTDPSLDSDHLCLVVPRRLVPEVLQLVHDIPLSGHFGHEKTLEKLRKQFYWPFMSRDCNLHVQSCSACNKNKKPVVNPRAALGEYHAGVPLERVHLEFMGPFPVSKAGNRYILVIIDQFTKWVECYSLPDQTAPTVCRVFLDQFVARFGCPLQIHTDQGPSFEGDMFQSICSQLQISKTRTTPYRPCSNGQVERMNRTLLQMIRCYLRDQQDSWDEQVPQLASAMRATTNRSTGLTPNFMM